MSRGKKSGVEARARKEAEESAFAEAPAWKDVNAGWRPLFGNYRDLGFSFEWHEFNATEELDWARSFHPGSLELCLNLEGTGQLTDSRQTVELQPRTFAFYFQGNPPLTATRRAGENHRFITIEYAPAFLEKHFGEHLSEIHPLVRAVINGEAVESEVVPPTRLILSLQQLVEGLRRCPVYVPAQEMWFRSKALEVAAHLFFTSTKKELHSTRTQRLAQERVTRAKAILQERMQNPPGLEELAQMVSCSPSYLSRQFTQEGGLTMQQYLRQIRMERAAELLKTGKCNVTEAALEVGYNSLSHFSTVFHETFGCCPGLYPLKTPAQRDAAEDGKKSGPQRSNH